MAAGCEREEGEGEEEEEVGGVGVIGQLIRRPKKRIGPTLIGAETERVITHNREIYHMAERYIIWIIW